MMKWKRTFKINLNWKTEPAPKKLLKEKIPIYILIDAIYLWKL